MRNNANAILINHYFINLKTKKVRTKDDFLHYRQSESVEKDINRMVILNLFDKANQNFCHSELVSESIQRRMTLTTFSITNDIHVIPHWSDPETLLKFLHARFCRCFAIAVATSNLAIRLTTVRNFASAWRFEGKLLPHTVILKKLKIKPVGRRFCFVQDLINVVILFIQLKEQRK